VVVLEDTDGDGRMDKRTVFADQLVLARSIKVLDRGVLIAEPPNVWLMSDVDGDLKADRRTLVTDRYGRRDADPQNNANGFHWALDNRMYTAGQADIHLRLTTGASTRRGRCSAVSGASPKTTPAGSTATRTSRRCTSIWCPTDYYARNPNLVRTRGSYERLATGNEALNIVWPVRPNPGTNRAYQTGIDRPDGTLFKFTSVCAPTVYRGDRLPAELYGNVFVAEPAANLVSRLVLEEGSDGLTARKAYPQGEFLASTDERFRPVYLSSAPDGTLYIADLYRGIIEHRISITEYLRDQILERRLDRGTGFGRIYRVMHETTTRDSAMPLRNASTAELVKALSHPNGWWRDTAQRLLVERQDKAAAPALVALASSTDKWQTRLHALWTLDGPRCHRAGARHRGPRRQAPEVRNSAIRLAERWLGQPGHPLVAEIAKRVEDDNSWIRAQLGASLGALPAGPREDLLERLLRRAGDEPVTVDAALSSLRGSELIMVDRLRASAARRRRSSPPDDAVGHDRSQRRGRGCAERAGGAAEAATAEWQRSAMLRGLEVALLGAPAPGNAAGRGNAAPAARGDSGPAPVSYLSGRPRAGLAAPMRFPGRPTGRRRPRGPGRICA
jgi:hypothetical protein